MSKNKYSENNKRNNKSFSRFDDEDSNFTNKRFRSHRRQNDNRNFNWKNYQNFSFDNENYED